MSAGGLENGYFVEPAIVDNLPLTHQLFKNELFVPFLVVGTVESFDEALRLANDTEYGLCAGVYSKNKGELENFFEHIEAGVTYANRRQAPRLEPGRRLTRLVDGRGADQQARVA